MIAEFQSKLRSLNELIERFYRKEIAVGDLWRGTARYGAYPQRQPGRFFVRIRLPCGMVSPDQLEDMAWIAETWGAGQCHLTTRQCVEIHDLDLSDLVTVLGECANLGLDCVDTAGAAIRNIVVCPHAGAGKDEPVDVMPFAAWLATHLHGHPDYRSLPRKINIGVSCCRADCARTLIQDVGFQSRMSMTGEYLGFRVVVGGGLGASPRVGQTLIEFAPAAEILLVIDAILRVFNRMGARTAQGNGRLKFLVESLGMEAFGSEVMRELDLLKNSRPSYPPLIPHFEDDSCWEPPVSESMKAPALDDEKYLRWMRACVLDQNDGRNKMIHIPVPGGNLDVERLRSLAALAQSHGLGVRITPEQGLLLRGVRPGILDDVHRRISLLKLDDLPMGGSLVSCPGASTCQSAFTNCRALCKAVLSRLQADSPAFEPWEENVRVKISGCLNGCSQHAIADIGLEGMALSKANQWLPAYRVWLGGELDQEKVEFGRQAGIIPARQVPELLADMMACYRRHRTGSESFGEVLRRVGQTPFSALVDMYAGLVDLGGDDLESDWR